MQIHLRLTGVLILLNILVCGIIYYIGAKYRPEENMITEDLSVLNTDILAVDYLEITGENMPKRILKREGENWFIEEPIYWPANYFAVQRILTHLQFLEKEVSFSVNDIKKNGQTLHDYGLENPRLTLFYHTHGKAYSLKIGQNTQVENRLYILGPNETTIYVVSLDLLESLSADIEELRSQQIFDIPVFEVKGLSVQINKPFESKVRLIQQEGAWYLEAPIQTEADSRLVESTLALLSHAQIEDFIKSKEAELADQALLEPNMRITLQGNNRSQTLLLAAQNIQDNVIATYYAKREGNPTLFTVSATPFNRLFEAQDILRQRHFLKFKEPKLSEIEIIQSRKSILLKKIETGEWQVQESHDNGTFISLPADEKTLHAMIDFLSELRAVDFINDAPSSSDLEVFGLDNPQRIIKLDLGKKTEALIVGNLNKETGDLYAKIEDKPFIYTIRHAILNYFPLDFLHYRDPILIHKPSSSKIRSVLFKNLSTGEVIFEKKFGDGKSWKSVLDELSEEKYKALSKLLASLQNFQVKSYLKDQFTPEVTLDTQTQIPWHYYLNAEIAFPSGNSEFVDQEEFYFTERLGGQLQIGGSPQENMLFTLPQDLIDALFTLTFEKMLPPDYLPPQGEKDSAEKVDKSQPVTSESSANKPSSPEVMPQNNL